MRPAQQGLHRSRLLVTRVLTVAIAVASLAEMLFFAAVLSIDDRAPSMDSMLLWLVVNFAVPVLGGAIAFFVSLPWLRIINALTVIGTIAALPAWHPLTLVPAEAALSGGEFSMESGLPWVVLSSAPLVVAALLAWSGGSAWGLLLGASMVKPVVGLATTAGDQLLFAAFDVLLTLLASLLLGMLTIALLTAAGRLDSAAAAAAAVTAYNARDRARQASAEQTNAFVHDDILSTLLFGASNNPVLHRSVAASARSALHRLETLSTPNGVGHPVTVADFTENARGLTQRIDPSARFDGTTRGGIDVPTEAADALYAALTQALTNSVAHAGTLPGSGFSPARDQVTRSVTVASGRGHLEVRVQDDGRGFDPAVVPPHRLGLAVSIVGRMQGVTGGEARVASQPGFGATVTLRWALPSDLPSIGADSLLPEPVSGGYDLRTRASRGIGLGFIGIQLGLLLISLTHTSHPHASTGALVAIIGGVALVTSGRQRRPSRARSAAIVACVLVSSAMIFPLEPHQAAPRYEAWFLLANAFVLLALVFQKRARAAIGGLALMCVVVLIGSVVNGSGLHVGIALLVRPVLVFSLAAVCAAPLGRMQRRIHCLRSVERALLSEATFTSTHREHRRRHAVEIRGLAGDMLDILGAGNALTAAQVSQCLAVEGHLRDRVRGDRLVAGALVDSVWQARVRGVDVLLLDDSRGEGLPPDELERIRAWMSEHLLLAHGGSFTGRLLPPNRFERATTVYQQESGTIRRVYQSEHPAGSALEPDAERMPHAT